jgi:hypothetical protein
VSFIEDTYQLLDRIEESCGVRFRVIPAKCTPILHPGHYVPTDTNLVHARDADGIVRYVTNLVSGLRSLLGDPATSECFQGYRVVGVMGVPVLREGLIEVDPVLVAAVIPDPILNRVFYQAGRGYRLNEARPAYHVDV